MENLEIYNKVRNVPDNAKKEIKGGRLRGMTDINPMWRIKILTETFGPCGIGWKYVIKNKWVETAMAKDEITANVEIDLYYIYDGQWSEPIPGVGGSMLVANESKGLYVNDECYKMALTDAISVACKALGIGADVYWDSDNTKYSDAKKGNVKPGTSIEYATDLEKKTLKDRCRQLDYSLSSLLQQIGCKGQMTKEQHGKALIILKEIEESKNE